MNISYEHVIQIFLLADLDMDTPKRQRWRHSFQGRGRCQGWLKPRMVVAVARFFCIDNFMSE